MYCVENRVNRKYLQANFVFNITTSETRMYYVENGKNRNYLKANFFSKSRHRKPLCIMLKIGKIENN